MNLLAIDTSTELATVTLVVQDAVLSEEHDSLRQHAQLLLPMVQRLLATAGLSFSQLDGIIFGRGPGSFTGLRVGCSIAKGLAYAHDKPLFPVSSLLAIADEAFQTAAADVDILAMIDARMNQVYWGRFSRDATDVTEQVNFAKDVTVGVTKPLILAGVGVESYAPLLPHGLQEQIIKQCVIFPRAIAMVRLVQRGCIKAMGAAEALPVYVRNQVTHEKGTC